MFHGNHCLQCGEGLGIYQRFCEVCGEGRRSPELVDLRFLNIEEYIRTFPGDFPNLPLNQVDNQARPQRELPTVRPNRVPHHARPVIRPIQGPYIGYHVDPHHHFLGHHAAVIHPNGVYRFRPNQFVYNNNHPYQPGNYVDPYQQYIGHEAVVINHQLAQNLNPYQPGFFVDPYQPYFGQPVLFINPNQGVGLIRRAHVVQRPAPYVIARPGQDVVAPRHGNRIHHVCPRCALMRCQCLST